MAIYHIAFLQFADLMYAMIHFPAETPKRWDSIAELEIEVGNDIQRNSS